MCKCSKYKNYKLLSSVTLTYGVFTIIAVAGVKHKVVQSVDVLSIEI